MARNYEKNFGRLNRLWLEKGTAKKEKRPKLSTLKTSHEISLWLPSIKDELDFLLKQIEVPCYTDRKIDECRKRIHYLETEYKSFVRKLHQTNSNLKTIPWTARPYERKHKGPEDILGLHPMSAASHLVQRSLETPVLMHDHLYQDGEHLTDSDCEGVPTLILNQDMPLFNSQIILGQEKQSEEEKEISEAQVRESTSSSCMKTSSAPELCEGTQMRKLISLGLDYSSSEEET